MKWFFREQQSGEITRDPIIGEFFSTEAIDNPAEALVREGIQNALDAKRDAKQDNEIRIRLLLVTGDHAPAASRLSHWFDGAWNHLRASGNGLRDVPDEHEACPFLVFEDFGTTGLQGNVRQDFDEPGNQNSFFYFFRAEGRSGKSKADLGRWGIGKHVFPRSSRISTYFGLTVRADDGKQFLMGHTILKSHRLDSKNYAPDGYFGEPSKDSMLMMPISEAGTHARFCDDFNISRDGKPGLSIVVPYVDSEITFEQLKHAVITGYFYPILKGELSIDIETPDDLVRIDSRSLLNETSSLEGKTRDNLIPLVELAHWAAFRSFDKQYVLNPCTLDCPVWSEDLIPKEITEKIRNDLDKGRKLAVHVGITVQERGKSPVPTYFEVYLCQDGFDIGRPIFIRKGIIISDIHSQRSPGVRSLVVVSDEPLATLLGDSENPAHTQWQKDSSNFRNKYANGKNYIEFVTRFVSNFINTMGAKEKQEDPYLFIDIFSLPLDKPDDHPPKPIEVVLPKEGVRSSGDLGTIKTQEKLFNVSRIQGGFKIGPGEKIIEQPIRLDLKVAYDLRRGNPIAKYHTSDFNLEIKPINFQESLKGVAVVSVDNNHMTVDVLEPNFQLIVTGFDERRDLYVKVRVVDEVQND